MPMTSAPSSRGGVLVCRKQRRCGERDRQTVDPAEKILPVPGGVVGSAARRKVDKAAVLRAEFPAKAEHVIMFGGNQLPDDFRLFVDFLPKQGFHRVV